MSTVYLAEAIRIGDQIIGAGIKSKHGMSWYTMGGEAYTTAAWTKSEDIYSGVSGIALFLLELYKLTDRQKYLSAAREALRWVDWRCRNKPSDGYTFLTGRMGVAYAFLKFFEATNDEAWLQKACGIARQSGRFLQVPQKKCEYINGVAGTLLGLLHLHAATQDFKLLSLVHEYTDELIRCARYGRQGLYWDQNPEQIRPLCGFSHGTSGIGFVFLELGHYFQNPAFYFIAKQAFAYENQYFDRKMNSWQDLRIAMYTPQKVEALESDYRKLETDSLVQPCDTSAWCHGAPGIGLSRLRAAGLVAEPTYSKDAARAFNKTGLVSYPSFTLCHGYAGSAELFIEYPDGHSYAERVADAALKQKAVTGLYANGHGIGSAREDMSLFNGIAGVGYFMLRVHDHRRVPSILAPAVRAQAEEGYAISQPEVKRRLMENSFPRTMRLVDQAASKELRLFFERRDAGKAAFSRWIELLLPSLPLDVREPLKDVFVLESTKVRLSESTKSQALLYIKTRLEQKTAKRVLEQPDERFLGQRLALSAECTIFRTQTAGTVLLRQTAVGVNEFSVSQFCALVLESFVKPETTREVIANIIVAYNLECNEDKETAQKKVVQQVKEAVASSILAVV